MRREAKVAGLIHRKRFRWEVQSDFAEESEQPRRYIHVAERDERKQNKNKTKKIIFYQLLTHELGIVHKD